MTGLLGLRLRSSQSTAHTSHKTRCPVAFQTAMPVTTRYILITNLMHQLLFIHKIISSSTCFEPRVLIFRRIQLYTCSIWYCHSLWEFLVACRYTVWVRTDWRGKAVGGYNCILLKMSTRGSKHVEEDIILWINNNWCIKLVINI